MRGTPTLNSAIDRDARKCCALLARVIADVTLHK
jgi:hypothetical protein